MKRGRIAGSTKHSHIRVAIPDVVELLHARPELRGALPMADALDMAARWNA